MASIDEAAAQLLREARSLASLSQSELAQRAGVAQSVISTYEAGRRAPSLAMLRRLVEAAGVDLEVTLRPRPGKSRGLPSTATGQLLRRRRRALLDAAAEAGVGGLVVFGSAARGEDVAGSDIDIAAEIPSQMGLVKLGSLERRLGEVLGRQVDLVPIASLRPAVRCELERDGVPL